MRADSVFIPLQGGSAGETGTRSTGRAGGSPDGTDAFAGLLNQAQATEARSTNPNRVARPEAPNPGGTTPTPQGESEVSTSGSEAGVETATGPQILPHNPPVTDSGGVKDATGPQVLPGEEDKVETPEDPPVLPHNPPMVDLSKVKNNAGPQILPGEMPAPGSGKGAQLPQINPGLPPGPAITADDSADQPAPDAGTFTNEGLARTLADGQTTAPLAPALARRLLATHDAREQAAARDSGRTTDTVAHLKARQTGDVASSALQGAMSSAPPAGPSPSSGPALPVAGQGAQAAPDIAAAAVPPGGGEPPAPLASDAGAADSFKSALAAVDRGNGLSSLSRATVETTALIAAQIQNRLNGRSTRFEMALTPEGLGRVDVSLEIDKDGNLAARLAFDNPAAAAELRGRADELRRQLEQAGLHLDGDALQFTEREPSSGGDGFSGFDRRPFARAAALNDEVDSPVAGAGAWQPLTLTRDRVDLKV